MRTKIDIRQCNQENAIFLKKYQKSNATLREVYLYITDNSIEVIKTGITKGLIKINIPNELILVFSHNLAIGVRHEFIRFKDYMLNYKHRHLLRTEFVDLARTGMLEACKWMNLMNDASEKNEIYVNFVYLVIPFMLSEIDEAVYKQYGKRQNKKCIA